MGREENVEIFSNTQHMYRTNEALKNAVKYSDECQKLILESDDITSQAGQNRYAEPARVLVSKKRTFDAASAYKDKNVCVLNFASATNPGGGVVKGSTAQEECLCRCSTLYANISQQYMYNRFYKPHREQRNPLHNDDCIYTPEVTVFKTDNAMPKPMPEKEWYKVNVITCAAPNLREKPSNMMNSGDGDTAVKISDDELRKLHEKRLRRILDIAVLNKNEVVILGAYGCGAFQNPPRVVAQAALNVVREYLHCFEIIEFAVYCSPRDESNYKTFERFIRI